MGDLGRMLVGLGLLLVVAGALLMAAGRLHLPLGRLPGDISYKGRNTAFYFPLTTSILLSIVVSLILYAVGRFRR